MPIKHFEYEFEREREREHVKIYDVSNRNSLILKHVFTESTEKCN